MQGSNENLLCVHGKAIKLPDSILHCFPVITANKLCKFSEEISGLGAGLLGELIISSNAFCF